MFGPEADENRTCATRAVLILHIIVHTETKNVAVYICKANFTGDAEKHELTINKGDHVNVLDKTDGGEWILCFNNLQLHHIMM